MARAIGVLDKAQQAVKQQSNLAQTALTGVGNTAARAGAQAMRGAAGMGALARATQAARSVAGTGNLINTKYTKSGISGASSSLGGAAMQGPKLDRGAQNLGFGDRVSLAIKPMMDWNREAGGAIERLGEMRAAFAKTPFGMVAGGVGTLALGVAGLAKDLALAAVKAGALTLALGGIAAVGLTKMVVEMGAFAERSKRAFGFLMGDKAAGAEAFETGRKLAKEFNLDVEETVQQLIKLRAMQFKMPEAIELTKLSTDLQAISGDSEAAGRALTAITQIKAKGKLQSEELVGQLAEAGVSTVLVYEQLEKSLGKSRKDVLKALQNGAIDADTGIAAIKKAILHKIGTKEAGAAGKAFAQETLTGMWQGLMNAPKMFALDVADFLDTAPLVSGLKRLMEAFDNIDRKSVGDFVNSMIGGLAKALDAVIAFGEGFGEGFEEIRRAMGIGLDTDWVVDFARTAGKWLATFFADVIMWGKKIYILFQEIKPELQLVWDLGANAVNLFVGALGLVLPALEAIFPPLRALNLLMDEMDSRGNKPGSSPPLPVAGGPTPTADRYDRSGTAGSSGVSVNRIEVVVNASGSGDPKAIGEETKQGMLAALSELGRGGMRAAL